MSQINQEQTLQISTILVNQENVFEQKIISKVNFDIMVQTYIDSLNEKFKEKAFINEAAYKDIIKLLSPESNDKSMHNSHWRSWARNNFILKLVGNDYIVCKIPNNRTKEAMEKKQSEIISLPILIKEKMWKEFCVIHVSLGHAGISNTYSELKNKWSNVKQDLVAKFISKCITCSLHKSSAVKEVEGKPIIAKSFLSRVQVSNH
jgi:hypothetical protein